MKLCYLIFLNLLITVSIKILSQSSLTAGTIFLNENKVYNGYNLFAPLSDTITYLIDNCGRVVHKWASSFYPGQVAYLLENGKILRAGEAKSNHFKMGGKGGIIEIIDWDGNVDWTYIYSDSIVRQHHDIEYMPNGNILIIAWKLVSNFEAIKSGVNINNLSLSDFWSEHIIEVNPNNDSIVWEWNAWDHIIQDIDSTKLNYGIISQHPELININFQARYPDYFHINSIDYSEKLDQILVSVHNLSEIWIIDHSTTTLEAKSSLGGTYGKGGDLLYRWGNPATYDVGDSTKQMLWYQHDAQWIMEGMDSGKIMIFNNGKGRPCGVGCSGYSAVDIITPPLDTNIGYTSSLPLNFYWHYVHPDSLKYYSAFISGCQRLSNENTMICYGPLGTFVEIDSTKEVVWEYVNPILNNGTILSQGNNIPIGVLNYVFRTYKYAFDYQAFSGKTLTPIEYIELNPDSSLCIDSIILNINSSQFTGNYFEKIFLSNSNDMLNIYTTSTGIAYIYDTHGKLIIYNEINENTSIPVVHLDNGIYIVEFNGSKQKIIKF